MTLIEVVMLIPAFLVGYLAGGAAGLVWQSIRYDRGQRGKMDGSTFQPFAYVGGFLAIAAALVHWHAFGL